MIRCINEKDIKAIPWARVEFRDNPYNFRQVAFHVYHNDHHILEVSGAHANKMLWAFLDDATEFHLKQFKLGIEERLMEIENERS
jgi:hypothetical protein